ncbi:MAG: protein translocase subunit SecF [Spirochaetia bacterium]|jgi:preprotein translocase subunit SecF|nr:protein translocase subunit SecF [Spirochaetia bacterium]
MSEKIIQFTKVKIPMMLLSLIVIIGGITGIALNGGFNLGIDFLSGVNMRVQIAEKALQVSYTGSDRAVINISEGILQINRFREGGLVKEEKTFILSEYPDVSALASAVSSIEDITVESMGSGARSAASIIGLNYESDLTPEGVMLNCENTNQNNYANISDVREALSDLGNIQIQTVGNEASQEFIIRMQDKEGEPDFNTKASNSILTLLENKFGTSNIIIKQSDYVGPKFSKSIGYQSAYLTGFALLLILAYIWFRFKLAYAVSAISALVHDVIVMLGVIGTFRIEVNTATIAAVLTIIGYSLNDTIVIFDRIRENQTLLRDKDFVKVVNISITQSLSRTLITSLTTLLAVLAIYIFGSGMIKIFALNLIIGVVVGTYSSIFIASPILLEWVKAVKKKKVDAAEKKYVDKQISQETKEKTAAEDEVKETPVKTVKPAVRPASPRTKRSGKKRSSKK